MQLHIFDDVGLSCLQRLFDLNVSVRFCEPFPAYRGHLCCICISCPQILLYKSWLLSQAQYVCGIHYHVFIQTMFMPACTIYFSPLFIGRIILCTVLSRQAQVCLPRLLQNRYSLIKETCHTCKSRLLRVLSSSALFYLIFLSLTPPSVSSD